MAENPGDLWDEILILPEEMAGVWANEVRVTRSAHEFTLDFARVDFARLNQEAIMVSRVAMSPLLFMQLRERVNTAWESYAEQALPNEVEDGRVE